MIFMDAFVNLVMMVIFVGGVLLFLLSQPRAGFSSVGIKMQRAVQSPWSLSEFLHLRPSRWKFGQYYSFSEETVRSLGYRFIGRFDNAILHWEDAPVLDLIIEHKFPVKYLPKKSRQEDIFQAGLYALALLERGVSCSSTRLVNIYCLQDRARRCMEKNSSRECWRCSDSKIYIKRFDSNRIIRSLKKMDEVWYKGRKPRPSTEHEKCIVCPYSIGKCNYSAV